MFKQFLFEINLNQMKSKIIFLIGLLPHIIGLGQTPLYINSDVKITSGTGFYSNGSDLVIQSNANIVNDGNWTLKNANTSLTAGSNVSGTGSLFLNSPVLQVIDGNGNSINCSLYVNNNNNISLATLATGTPSANNDLYVGGNLIFQKGYLVTGNNKVVLQATANYSGASDSSHVNGWCQKAGATAFVFPVGNGVRLRTAAISAPGAPGDNFICKYYKTSPHPLYNITQKDTTLQMVSMNEYWELNRVAGSSAVTVTLSWLDSFSGIIGSLPNLRVARWNGTKWADHGNGGTTGSFSSGTINSAAVVSSFNAFTLGTTTMSNILPVELLDFTATKKDKTALLQWKTASERNSDYFIVERSDDRLTWTEIGRRTAAGFSNTVLSYLLTDFEPKRGMNYYRLKQVDRDYKYAYSPVRSLMFLPESTVNVYPNPATDQINIESGIVNESYLIFDNAGKMVLKGDLKTTVTSVNIDKLASGAYIIKLIPENQTLKFEKY